MLDKGKEANEVETRISEGKIKDGRSSKKLDYIWLYRITLKNSLICLKCEGKPLERFKQ